jgi:Co/Zn/Cd efflux system component
MQSPLACPRCAPSYRRGFAMQAPIAVVSALLGTAAWWTSGDPLWAVGAVIMITNWPYTLLAIMPTNHLLEATASGGDRDTRERLVRWGRLHAVRSALGATATLVYLVAAQRTL